MTEEVHVTELKLKEYRVWRYCVKPTKYGEWGIFLIDNTGYFSVVSDFGNYAYFWSHYGDRDFREFLVRLEPQYLCSKLCPRKVVDEEGTLKLIREILDQAKEDGSLSEDELESERLHLDELEEEGVQMGFSDWYDRTKLSDAWEYMRYDYPSDLKGFVEKVYPRFVAQLRKDLEA